MHQETDMEFDTHDLNPAYVAHCILYVLKATTNLDEMPPSVESMIKYLKDKNTEGNHRFF